MTLIYMIVYLLFQQYVYNYPEGHEKEITLNEFPIPKLKLKKHEIGMGVIMITILS